MFSTIYLAINVPELFVVGSLMEATLDPIVVVGRHRNNVGVVFWFLNILPGQKLDSTIRHKNRYVYFLHSLLSFCIVCVMCMS